jgi:predicted ribonuclease YlaK
MKIKKMIKFYDTSSLLLKVDTLFEKEEEFAISSITLEELEYIKNAANKDVDIKYAARKLTYILDDHMGEYDVEIFNESMLKPIVEKGIYVNNDAKILACGLSYREKHGLDEEIVFMTNDICLKHIAALFFTTVWSVNEEVDTYTGYKHIQMSDDEMAYFYTHQEENLYDLLINEYLIIHDENGDIVDRLCRTQDGYRPLSYGVFSSKWFGDVKPVKGDIYQDFVADSFSHNKITLVKGPAGSGKTFLSLAYLIHKLEKGKIDKIIIFCNTVATKDSAKLGYYPGTRDEKLLDSQIGNLLSSKFGGRCEVERMIQEEKLVLLPMSDVRGYDTSGMRAGVYISEAQNMSINLMKLALQRIGEDSICIIDGDYKAQVDDIQFAGSNNGMKRASKVFRGEDIYGEITLQNIHRSKIGRIAERM